MDQLDYYIMALAVGSVVLPLILVLAFPRHRRGSAIAIWLLAPLAVFVGILTYETITRPGYPISLHDALLGFSLISALAIVPWLILSAVGALFGLFLRYLIAKLR